MSKIINLEIQDEKLIAFADYLIDLKTYEDLKERIIEQIVRNTEIPGFRKGKAPRKLVLANSDPAKITDSIVREVIFRHFSEAQNSAKDELAKQGRYSINSTVVLNPEFNKETEEGFQIRLTLVLLPKIDISYIDTLEVEVPAEDQIENRISQDDFLNQEVETFIRVYNDYEETDEKSDIGYELILDIEETNDIEKTPKKQENLRLIMGVGQFPASFEKNLDGVKAGDVREFSFTVKNTELKYKVTVKKVGKPIYKTIEEVFANVKKVSKDYESADKFRETVLKAYNRETKEILDLLKKRIVIREVVDNIPDYHMNLERIEPEIERIWNTLNSEAEARKKPVAEIYVEAGLPTDIELKTDNDTKKAVENYVQKEFKLADLLQVIYHSKIENKTTEEELETIAKDIKADPAKYNVDKAELKDSNELRDIAFDRLLRSKAFKWITEKISYKPLKTQKTAKTKKTDQTSEKKSSTIKSKKEKEKN